MRHEREFNQVEAISTTIPQDQLVGKSQSFICVKRSAASVAKRRSTVLILGETGTGKHPCFLHSGWTESFYGMRECIGVEG